MSAPPRDAAAATTLAVGIGQCVVSHDPDTVLAAYGLGSCIGLAAWDAVAQVAGMIHILLPEPSTNATELTPARFATTGVPYFLRQLEAAGAKRTRLMMAAVGGAQMFNSLALRSVKGIGQRNSEIVSALLRTEGIAQVITEFGGSSGRTLTLSVATGQMLVRAADGQPRELACRRAR